MNVLLIGNGGREHALAWKIRQSKLTSEIFIAPGNAGTAMVGMNVAVKADDFAGIERICRDKNISLVVIGPEAPLVDGLRDHLEEAAGLDKLLIIGPGRNGAQLEGSKDFSKQFMLRHGIPTAQAKTFRDDQLEEGLAYLSSCSLPIVLKADGLAAGKGVVISTDGDAAKNSLRDMLENKIFGAAGSRVLIEEFLEGIELSVFVLTDGVSYTILPEAKDYKRIGDDDTGPNTGGMGAVSPVPFADQEFMKKVESEVIKPTIAGLKKENIPYRGFIFFGLMNVRGEPYVIEYNARMGDPETQVVMTRIQSDFVEALVACARQELLKYQISISPSVSLAVVMASNGYPGDYEKGKKISGANAVNDGLVFHAGTKKIEESLLTDGGRVLAVVGQGANLQSARKQAYQTISAISWEGVYFRKDIGVDLLTLNQD